MRAALGALLVLVALDGAARAEVALTPVRLEAFVGAKADGYSTLAGGDAALAGVHGALAARLGRRLGAQLELLGGGYSSGDVALAAAGRAYYRDARLAVGVLGGHTAVLDGVRGQTLGGFLERYEDARLRVSVAAGYERRQGAAGLWFAEALLSIYPAPAWLVHTGVSYAQAEIKQTRADILLHVEREAYRGASTTLAVYLRWGGNLFTRGSAGVVLYFDAQGYGARERTRGVHGLRFK